MTNPKWEEQIIVVPVKELFSEVPSFQGTLADQEKVQNIFGKIEDNFSVMRRGDKHDSTPAENNAEINFDFKQPIPYAIIKRGNDIFVTERLEGAGESRLHGKLSIGAGGHMNKTSPYFNESLLENLMRELKEELVINLPQGESMHLETFGFINDEIEEVSKVHIGILVFVTLPEGSEVSVNPEEKDQLRGFWSNIEELSKPENMARLESWSQIAVNTLIEL
jgi:predicted NUDIX family phosphoesterase